MGHGVRDAACTADLCLDSAAGSSGISEREQNPLVLHRIKVASPTGRTILEEFDSVLHLIVRTPDGQVEHRLQGVTEGGIRILRWLQLKRRPLLSAAGASLTLIQS